MNKTNSSHVGILIILMVIAVIMFVYYITDSNKTEYDNSGNQTITNEVKTPEIKSPAVSAENLKLKAEILKKVSVKGVVLSAKEKADIFKALSGDNMNDYGFTNEEKKKIVEALNRK